MSVDQGETDKRAIFQPDLFKVATIYLKITQQLNKLVISDCKQAMLNIRIVLNLFSNSKYACKKYPVDVYYIDLFPVDL
jgi:hypothetical protein